MKGKDSAQGTLFPELEEALPLPKKTRKVSKTKEENLQLKEEIKALKLQLEESQKENENLRKENAKMFSKVQVYDELIHTPSLITIGDIAKNYGKTANWLNQYLHKKGIQYPSGDIWKLYAQYDGLGLTGVKFFPYAKDSNGRDLIRPHTYWSYKGLLFIRKLLKEDRII